MGPIETMTFSNAMLTGVLAYDGGATLWAALGAFATCAVGIVLSASRPIEQLRRAFGSEGAAASKPHSICEVTR